MPKVATRIWLKVLSIRKEHLQDISEKDARAEGVVLDENKSFTHACIFQELWDSINSKKYPWLSNPWVWVYEFKVQEIKQ